MGKANPTKKRKKNKKVLVNLDELKPWTSDEILDDAYAKTPPFQLQNVVATFNIGIDRVDLRDLALTRPFIEYNPHKFAAATMRIASPRTTALAFASGNMVCTGAKNEALSRLASRKYVRLLQKHDVPVSFRDFKIQNIVAATNVQRTIKLNELAQAYGPYVSYEPDLFPGLVFRTTAPKLVFLIFRSGKIVITGAKERAQIASTYDKLYQNVIKHFFDVVGSSSSSSEYRTQLRRGVHPPNFFDQI
jgi:transcription initiation factor TFIID TATA-box-binding protein